MDNKPVPPRGGDAGDVDDLIFSAQDCPAPSSR